MIIEQPLIEQSLITVIAFWIFIIFIIVIIISRTSITIIIAFIINNISIIFPFGKEIFPLRK